MKKLVRLSAFFLCLWCCNNANAQTELTFYTTMGNFKAVLTDTLTPQTVDSFVSRVISRFYDGLIFHRVIDNFMIQGGDPLGTGYGGPGYTTPDEFVSTLKNVPGALAMANSGPNTNGSQFYINLVNNAYLNGHYTVFGMTTSNFSVVQAIGHVATDTNDRPLTNVIMDSVRITRYPASVSSIGKDTNFSVYPNPNHGIFTIHTDEHPTDIEVADMAGHTIFRTTSKGQLNVNITNHPPGLYIIRVGGLPRYKVIYQ